MKIDNEKNKRMFVIGIVTLLVTVIGATYAYFVVQTSNTFNTSTISADLDTIGSVALVGSQSTLNLSLSKIDMMKGNTNIYYYASTQGKTLLSEEEVVGTASISPNTDPGYYHCTYTLQVSQSYSGTKNLYNIFKGNQAVGEDTYSPSKNELVLIVNGKDYDLYSNTLTKEIPGEFYIHGTEQVKITAGLYLDNLWTKNQSLLAGSGVDLAISVKNNTFNCELVESSAINYWTYQGNEVGTGNANKESSYQDLKVWQRTYNGSIYSYMEQSDCTSSIVGSETCSEVTQPFFIKESSSEVTSTETINEFLLSIDGGTTYYTYNYFNTEDYAQFMSRLLGSQLPCNGNAVEIQGIYLKCVAHPSGYTYNKPLFELCVNNSGNVACLNNNPWNRSDEVKAKLEAVGLTCKYYDSYDGWVNSKPVWGSLTCQNTNPANGRNLGNLYFDISQSGYSYCGISGDAACYIAPWGEVHCE